MFKKIFGIFKKEKKMDLENKTVEELNSELKAFDFQWLKGENQGAIEKFESILENGDSRFITFRGGNRINVNIVREFMDMFPAVPDNFNPAPVSPTPPSPSQPSPVMKGTVNSVSYGSTASGVEDSPIYSLLKKQKPNWVDVSISLKLNLPTKSLYNVLISSFEDAETEIANYVTEGIDIEDVKNAIAESIKASFYNAKKTSGLTTDKKIKQIEDGISEE